MGTPISGGYPQAYRAQLPLVQATASQQVVKSADAGVHLFACPAAHLSMHLPSLV